MPCYEIRTISVEFNIKNIALLKKAIENAGYIITTTTENQFNFHNLNYNRFSIDLIQSKISSSDCNEKMVSLVSNSIKRTYSESVINEMAKKNKWIKQNMGKNQFQLQRF